MYRQATIDRTEPFRGSSGGHRSVGFTEDWWSLYLPALVVVACAVWVGSMPVYTGYCLFVFVPVAVVLLARARRSSIAEKCTWATIALVLLVGEGFVNYRAHEMAKTFVVCTFSAPGTATVQLHGAATLRSVSMAIVNHEELAAVKASRTENGEDYVRIYQDFPIGLLRPGLVRTFPVKSPKIAASVVHYRVQFSAENGYWWEDFQAVKRNGEPVTALRIVRFVNGKPGVLFEQEDQGFPRSVDGTVDWTWASREP